ncbi:RDD [Candidatus Nanopelagicaceae bacterium]
MNSLSVNPSRRFTAWVLELVLISGTAYIGWFIWSLITWGKGQTPAQNLLRIISIDEATGAAAKRSQMFVRFFLIFTTYWIAYFAVSNLAYAINPSGFLLATGILIVLAVQLFDISGIVRRSDHRRLADVISGISVKEMETQPKLEKALKAFDK